MEKQPDKVVGHVFQVIGPVVDVAFKDGAPPEIYTAIRITSEGFDVPEPVDIIVEAEQHIGEDKVRCVSMHPTEGLSRGMKAESLGGPIEVPVGEGTRGRVMNVGLDHVGGGQRQQMLGALAPSRRHGDAVAATAEDVGEVASQKPGAANKQEFADFHLSFERVCRRRGHAAADAEFYSGIALNRAAFAGRSGAGPHDQGAAAALPLAPPGLITPSLILSDCG